MTRFAKPLVLETPCCQQRVLKQRFASINSFGISTRWSDGYSSIPMVSEASRLAYCPSCNKTYWLEDATELGVAPSFDEKSPRRFSWLSRKFWKGEAALGQEHEAQVGQLDLDFIDYHQDPRPADLLLAVLRQEWSSQARELYLRTRLWWIGNHRQRGWRMVSPMDDAQTRANMLRLLELHQEAAEDRDIKSIGELFRQLGRFDEAVAELDGHRTSLNVAAAIHAAALRGESVVFEVETF